MRKLLVSILLLLSSLSLEAAGEKITINFKNTDIREVAEMVSRVTGKNFLIDPRVKGKVTVISAEPIDGDTLYDTFLTILKAHGFIAVKVENLTKLLPAAIEREHATFRQTGPITGAVNDEVEVQVIPIKHVPVVQMVPILRPLVEKEGHLAAHNSSNSLIVAATRRTIHKIYNMLGTLDQAAESEIESIKLYHADATEMVRTLQTLVQGTANARKGKGSNTSRLVADNRTNSILVSGNTGFRSKIRRIVMGLDTKVKDRRNVHVVRLKFAKAKDLAPIIEKIAADKEAVAKRGKGKTAAGEAELTTVQSDDQTNALIITAKPEKMAELRDVIRRLDVRRAQVLVEAIIAEIRHGKDADLGIQWLAINNTALDSGDSDNVNNALSSLTSGAIGPGTIIGVIERDSITIASLAKALDNDTDANLLSTPSILTMDNQEAEISVGQEVPFETGSYTNSGNSVTNPFTTVERKKVGLTLKITPQISDGDAVKLDIDQEISSVDAQAASNIGARDVVTNLRTIKTSVLVDNKKILVLGGLISDSVNETEQRVPLLGDIPVVGEIFTQRSSSKDKQNLMLFIRPSIIRNSATNLLVTNKYYNHIRKQQLEEYIRGVRLLPEADQPLLKPINAQGQEITFPSVPVNRQEPASAPDNLWFH